MMKVIASVSSNQYAACGGDIPEDGFWFGDEILDHQTQASTGYRSDPLRWPRSIMSKGPLFTIQEEAEDGQDASETPSFYTVSGGRPAAIPSWQPTLKRCLASNNLLGLLEDSKENKDF